MLVLQIVTGIVLAMHYTPHTSMAFDSVEHIMRDVNYGWLLRYAHANGASMFFIVVYIHIFRGLYYGSYKAPRELLWMLGVVILLLMMATAFMGYVLPWGQMSFWGATVITNLFSAFPLVGESIVTWLWGGFAVDNPTLNRFFSLHYLLPFVIVGVVMLHLVALHQLRLEQPGRHRRHARRTRSPSIPTTRSRTCSAVACSCWSSRCFVFCAPNLLGHPDNYIPANPLVTPAHIVPEWYFLPFYAILRAPFASRTSCCGVLAMFGSIAVLFLLPWLDTSPVRSARFRPIYKWLFWVLVIDCVVLAYVGGNPPEGIVHHGRPGRDDLLLRPLPGGHAAARQARAAAAAAGEHRQAGARRTAACTLSRRSDGRCAHARSPVRGRSRPGRAGASAREAAEERRHAGSAALVVRWPVRHLRPGGPAARLPGLQGGLPGLPRRSSTWRSATSQTSASARTR